MAIDSLAVFEGLVLHDFIIFVNVRVGTSSLMMTESVFSSDLYHYSFTVKYIYIKYIYIAINHICIHYIYMCNIYTIYTYIITYIYTHIHIQLFSTNFTISH